MRGFFTIMFVVVCGFSAFAYDFSAVCESGQTLYYDITSNVEPYTVGVTAENSGSPFYTTYPTGDLGIPETIGYNGVTYSVTSIGDNAFGGCSGLTSITISNSVASIGDYAFSGCSGLTSVTIPNSVTSIGRYAFYGCSGLTTVNFNATNCTTMGSSSLPVFCNCTSVTTLNIGENVTVIPSYAFKNCSGLTSVTIPNSVTSIGDYAFSGCSGLTSITIPNYVTSIGSSAFSGCSGLTSVTIPSSVTSIGGYAFYRCLGLTTVNFNATNCTTMGSSSWPVFYNCTSVTTLNIGENVTVIPSYAFKNCSGLTSVTIPNSVTRIGSSAFSGCSGLTSVTIPNSVTSIGDYAFSGCSGLTSVTIPDSVTSIGNYAFGGCSGLTTINFNATNCASEGVAIWNGCSSLSTLNIGENVTIIPTKAFSDCSGLTSVTIPNSVTSIGQNAFSGCSGLTSITIPSSVTSIGGCAFYRCLGLATVNFNATNCTTMGSSSLPVFYNCTSFTTLNIGENVTVIPSYAFSGCSGLTSVTIPNSVTSIGDYAFKNCSGLTSVTIPNSVTSIESYTFENCIGLTSVTIGNSVTSIGNSAFSGCSGLTTVNFNATNCTTMGSTYYHVFQNCNANATINIGNGVTVIPDYAFYGLLGNGVLIIPNSVTSIGRYAFYGCSNLTSVTIPNSFTSIGDDAFKNCSGLTSVTIPNSVTRIGSSAFSGCTGLTSVTIPNSVTSIGNNAFYLVINIVYEGPATGSPWGALTVNGIFDGDFIYSDAERTNLTAYIGNGGDVVIPNSVTSIGSSVFSGCSGLTSVTIPNYVTSIGSSAFSGCSGLTSVTIPNFVTSIGNSAFSGCSGLTSVVIPNSVTSIGSSAFSGCSGLTSVTIPNSVTSIGNSAFSNCSGLNIVNFNATNCTTMGSYSYPVFQNCNANAIINIGEGVTTIPDEAFRGLLGNDILIIPNSVTSIGVDAFDGCSGLTSVTIGNSVTNIGGDAFYGCSGLTGDLIIPNSVVSVGTSAFSNCSGLTSVTIGNSVTSIGVAAFNGCSGLVTVNFNATNCLTMGKASSYSYTPVFRNCTSFTTLNIGENVTNIPDSAFYGCSSLVTAEMPDVVARIGGYSFYGCSGLSDISIPNSVVGVGENAFTNTGWYNSHSDGILYLDGWYLGYKSTAPVGELALNATTRGVAADAFAECTGITSVTLSSSIITIGEKAFKNCHGLGSVYIPDSVQTIGDSAFYMVANIVYNGNATGRPWGALSMNNYNFDGIFYTSMAKDTVLSALRTIESANIPNSVVCILPNAFRGCTSLTEINIPDSVKVIGEYAFAGCSNVSTLTIGSAVDSIGLSAFDGCLGLTTVNFNARNCTYMGSSSSPVFGNSPSVTTLNIDENVTNIPNFAFFNCSSLTGPVTLPNSLTKIGNRAFNNCSNLTGPLTLPDSLAEIGYNAFYNCSSLTGNLIIPNSVVRIGQYAFGYCSEFTSVTIGTSVTSIGFGAFYNCSNLSVINYNAVRMDLFGSTDAFYRGTNNAVLNIGDSVVIIPDQEFFSTTSDTDLAEINVSTANPIFDSRENSNAVIETATNKLVLGCKNTIIPNSVTSIGNGAFKHNPNLTSINIPNSVTSIGYAAFSGCSGLTSIAIPNSVTSIGNSTFSSCSGLTSVTIPNTITSIGSEAFYGCSGLAEVTIPNSVTSIGEEAFRFCTGLTSVTIPNSVTIIGEEAFYYCRGLVSVSIGNSVTRIPNEVFYNCDSLADIYVKSTVPPSITYNTFNNNYSSATLWVPCGYAEVYGQAALWRNFNDIRESGAYQLSVESNNNVWGDVVVTQQPSCEDGIAVISATPNDHCYFVQWNDGSTDNPRTITVTADTTFTASFITDQYTVSVVSADETMGTVGGSGTFDYFTRIWISAIANEHYHFVQWDDGNTNNPRTIIVTGDTTYTASFVIDQHTITVLPDDENMGFVAGGGSYDYGIEIQISAIASEHSHFVQWNDGNTDNPRTIVVEGDTTYTATFALDQHTITVLSDDENMGSVVGGGTYGYGAEIQISATSNEHYHFVQWNDGNTDNPRTIIVTGDTTYTATFAINQYTIAVVSADETMGTVSEGGTYDYGTEIQISATASEHYHFAQWNDGNTDNPRTITVNGNVTYTAEFAIDQHAITVVSADDAMGTVSGSGTYDYGAEIVITATENEGHGFIAWDDGNTDNPRTITVTGDSTYTATFGVLRNVEVYSSDESMGHVIGSGEYVEGSEIQITAIPNEHYHFLYWIENDNPSRGSFSDNPLTIIVTNGVTYTAVFAIDQHIVTVVPDNDTMGTAIGSGSYEYGSEIEISANANNGYRFEQWDDGNTDNPRTLTVTEDVTYTAQFAIIIYHTIVVRSLSEDWGTVSGGGTFPAGSEIQISATPNPDYAFVAWTDGNTDNPRTIIVTEDAEYAAAFTWAGAVEQTNFSEIAIFPNPATNILNITSSETISEIEIVNVMGQLVRRIEVNSDNAVCNVEDLRSGVYVVRIRTASATLSQRKFIKE